MNKNILIVLGGAVLAAVLVAMLVQMTLGKKGGGAPADMVEILVASKDLRIGHELKEGDLTWKEWPEDGLFKGAILKKEDEQDADSILEGKLERSIAKHEPVLRSALLKTTGNIVVSRLDVGERAVSVQVAAEDVVAGFLVPGAYVDVILTYDEKLPFAERRSTNRNEDNSEVQDMVALNLGRKASETILQNIRVLAVDQKAELGDDDDDKKKAKKPSKKSTVTLAVAIRDAEKLVLASEMGRVTLAMRGVGDDKPNEKLPVVSDKRLTTLDDEIFAEYMKIKNGGSMDNGVVKSSSSIKVYSGAQMNEMQLR